LRVLAGLTFALGAACVPVYVGPVPPNPGTGAAPPPPMSAPAAARIVDLQYGGSFCALRSDGRVACWGANASGSLGDGSNEARSRPAVVPGLDGVRLLRGLSSPGFTYTQGFCALRTDASLWCWGFSGTEGPAEGVTPRRLAGDVVEFGFSVAADESWRGVCARNPRGAIACFQFRTDADGPCVIWADDSHSRCLSSARGVSFLPRAGPAPSDIRWGESVSLRSTNVACTIEAGRVACPLEYLDYMEGVVARPPGAASTNTFLVPGLTDMSTVSGGSYAACAVRADGRAFCWGDSDVGELPVPPDTQPCRRGRSSFDCNRRPVPIPVDAVKQVELGDFSRSVIVTRAGGLLLGCHPRRQAMPCTTPLERVVGVPPVDRVVVAPTTGTAFCALTIGGQVYCVGRGVDVGDGALVASRAPVQVPGIVDAVEVAVVGAESCARTSSGAVTCWGGLEGPRGLSEIVALAPPCALARDGRVWCWGSNSRGEMGLGYRYRPGVDRDPEVVHEPMRVLGLERVSALSSSSLGSVCALTAGGLVSCWGFYGEALATVRPIRIAGLPLAKEVWTGTRSQCALTFDGRVFCFTDHTTPVERPELRGAGRLPRRGAGQGPGTKDSEPLCIVTSDGALRCTGMPAPLPEIADVRQLSLSSHLASELPRGCVVLRDGRLQCWGPPYCAEHSQSCVHGVWNRVDTILDNVRDVALDHDRGCAVRTDGTVWCWGSASPRTFGGPYPEPMRIARVAL
jgi:alpha-tubulin suppressor-like RCC1 family protein